MAVAEQPLDSGESWPHFVAQVWVGASLVSFLVSRCSQEGTFQNLENNSTHRVKFPCFDAEKKCFDNSTVAPSHVRVFQFEFLQGVFDESFCIFDNG